MEEWYVLENLEGWARVSFKDSAWSLVSSSKRPLEYNGNLSSHQI